MKNLDELERNLGYKFKDERLLKEALTHKSCRKPYSNERLEFLGDAVMDLLVGEYLFKKFSRTSEGDMSKLRAALVNEKSFAQMAGRLKLADFIYLLSDAFEAVIGAIYLEAGLEKAREIGIRLLEGCFPKIDFSHLVKDYKTQLQEITQATHGVTPSYELIGAKGPDHDKEFQIALLLNGREISRASGKSKKEAEQKAAKIAVEVLNSARE